MRMHDWWRKYEGIDPAYGQGLLVVRISLKFFRSIKIYGIFLPNTFDIIHYGQAGE